MPVGEIQALRQVMHIDLYLRAGKDLHLLELKRPTVCAKWQFAAEELTRQWRSGAAWLSRGVENVHLWVVTPVRWSRSKGTAKIPNNWQATFAAIAGEHLTGRATAKLGMLFYVIVRSRTNRLFLVLWRADEPEPALKV
jgi:hypothetical protein